MTLTGWHAARASFGEVAAAKVADMGGGEMGQLAATGEEFLICYPVPGG
jgi:hypothetical protein